MGRDGRREVDMSAQTASYPVRVEGALDPQLSRWMWLVKWFLAIPHFVVLAFLWVAYCALSVVAFFAILFTGRYPRGMFEFNAGVLRWSWRVSYYALGAMGTDQYPPFTLRDVSDYPAHFDVDYPERLSRGLVLVKWWLLAIPHYIIVGILMGGTWFAWRNDDWRGSSIGLIGVLALVAAITLAATGRYPKPLFDLILGLNRWVLRVAAYTGLMTDHYPPFRLDTGGSDAHGVIDATFPAAARTGSGWTGGRIFGLVAGIVLSFVGLTVGGAGGLGLWADQTQRDAAGFLVTSRETLVTGTYALVAEDISIPVEGPDRLYPEELLGDARFRVTATDDAPVFVGIARAADVERYLDGVAYATAADFLGHVRTEQRGGPPATAPANEDFWVRSATGPGTQTLKWAVSEGEWTIVVMNADGRADVAIEADAGLEAPPLTAIAAALLVGGAILLALAVFLVAFMTARASGRPHRGEGR